MSKHTPGPWFVCHKSPFIVRAGDDISGRHIAHIGPANYTPRFDIDEPNARLIAAAPDLLDALERLVSAARDADHGYMDQAIDNAESAISKARGQS